MVSGDSNLKEYNMSAPATALPRSVQRKEKNQDPSQQDIAKLAYASGKKEACLMSRLKRIGSKQNGNCVANSRPR